MTDFESGTRKTIDITVKAEKITADILKSALQEFMNGKAEKKGRMTYKQLESKSPSKLDNIDVSSENIADFLKTARKYDVDFALKSDNSTNPQTYHVFFSAAKTEDFKRAFTEYLGRGQQPNKAKFSRELLHKQAQRVAQRPRKRKERQKSRDTHR